MSLIDVKAERGKVNVRFPLLGGKRYRMGITPAYARELARQLEQEAAAADALADPEPLDDGPWSFFERLLRGGRR